MHHLYSFQMMEIMDKYIKHVLENQERNAIYFLNMRNKDNQKIQKNIRAGAIVLAKRIRNYCMSMI